MKNKYHPLQRLLAYGQQYRGQTWQAAIASVFNKLCDVAPEILIGMAVDVVVKKQDSFIANLGIRNVEQQLIILTVITVIVWVLESLSQYIYTNLWRNLSQKIQHNLRLDAYGHIQQLELAYFENQSTGNLMAILGDDINQLERFLDIGANEIIQVLTNAIVIGGVFFVLAPNLAWWSIVPIPIIIIGSIWFQKYLAPYYSNVREKVGLLNSRLANNLGGITTIKSFTTEAYELDRVRADSEAYRQSNRRAIAVSAAFVPLIRMAVLFSFTMTLLLGGLAAVNGQLGVGTYSILIYLTQRLLWPLTRLGETLDLYQRGMASTHRVMDLLDTPIAIDSGNLTLPSVRGDIEFKDVTFAYPDRSTVVKKLSLKILAGQTIAIVGATGSGKSTLVKLLLRLYEIQSGTITLDGINIQDLHLVDLRRSIGLVSQDVFLFHGSVRENIAYGSPDADLESVVAAAKIAEADEFIVGVASRNENRLPEGYETIVGERGQKLSGGQRQRIAIARAVLKNPPILILDEATSAVDNETEAAIQRSLDRITLDRTTIAIAHRLSTIRNADRIYVMERGELVEAGTHDELLALNSIYAGLWNIQQNAKFV
ncbi:ABC transporter ATP-binding protein [Chamaesiphon sp. VAR_48_metabat_135_sub]|uniref:ABC transporter ATP-binding protein n=1 Tax=Chamaesiphon sp. VAR_48_metabat_135_sub TaxID=2964699 RepID=UPI00286BC782|nr:ABC transporter ATP-binding protein [Chamaesiphon sp. VAR_48_metabat_135_sub]